MVAVTADYRVSSRNQTNVTDSVRDAKAAIRYIRGSALRLRIDPERIAAGGGSAGGHLAVSTALLPGFDEDSKISSRPNALILFNPVVLLAPVSNDEQLARIAADIEEIPELKGVDAISVSPWHHVSSGARQRSFFMAGPILSFRSLRSNHSRRRCIRRGIDVNSLGSRARSTDFSTTVRTETNTTTRPSIRRRGFSPPPAI
jgi:hypothetical protein